MQRVVSVHRSFQPCEFSIHIDFQKILHPVRHAAKRASVLFEIVDLSFVSTALIKSSADLLICSPTFDESRERRKPASSTILMCRTASCDGSFRLGSIGSCL